MLYELMALKHRSGSLMRSAMVLSTALCSHRMTDSLPSNKSHLPGGQAMALVNSKPTHATQLRFHIEILFRICLRAYEQHCQHDLLGTIRGKSFW